MGNIQNHLTFSNCVGEYTCLVVIFKVLLSGTKTLKYASVMK